VKEKNTGWGGRIIIETVAMQTKRLHTC